MLASWTTDMSGHCLVCWCRCSWNPWNLYNSITFYFRKKKIIFWYWQEVYFTKMKGTVNWANNWWQNALPANIRKWIFPDMNCDGRTSFMEFMTSMCFSSALIRVEWVDICFKWLNSKIQKPTQSYEWNKKMLIFNV